MKTATWLLVDGVWKCSHCKGNAIEMAEKKIAITMFCPHCGYKMHTEG